MAQFLSYFAQLLLYSLVPFAAFGLLIFCCQRLFCLFVTPRNGKPLLLAVSALSVPVRVAGQAVACFLFAHRIEDICFFDPNAEDGEFGYLDHSYNPKNPLAVVGNFFIAIGPIVMGLFAVLVVALSCFHGAFFSYAEEIGTLKESGAALGDYAMTALRFIPSVFRDENTAVIPKIIGCALMLLFAFSVYLSPADLRDAFGGIFTVVGLLFLFSGALCLFDERVRRMVLGAFRSFFMYLLALFSLALLFAAVLVALGFLYATVIGFFAPTVSKEEDETWKNN